MITKKDGRKEPDTVLIAGSLVVNKLRVITGAMPGFSATEVRGRTSHFTHTLKLGKLPAYSVMQTIIFQTPSLIRSDADN